MPQWLRNSLSSSWGPHCREPRRLVRGYQRSLVASRVAISTVSFSTIAACLAPGTPQLLPDIVSQPAINPNPPQLDYPCFPPGLRLRLSQLFPVKPLRQGGQHRLLVPLQETPHSESIDRFLARLPSLWQQGEAHPLTRREFARPGTGVPGRLPSKACRATCCCGFRRTPTPTPRICWHGFGPHSGRFSDVQLRTLQRRVKDWRCVMAKRLVYATSDQPASERSEKVELVERNL